MKIYKPTYEEIKESLDNVNRMIRAMCHLGFSTPFGAHDRSQMLWLFKKQDKLEKQVNKINRRKRR